MPSLSADTDPLSQRVHFLRTVMPHRRSVHVVQQTPPGHNPRRRLLRVYIDAKVLGHTDAGLIAE